MPTLAELATLLNVPCPPGVGDRMVTGMSSLEAAGPSELSVLTADKYVRQYKVSRAGAVLASKKIKFAIRPEVPVIVVDDADAASLKVLELLAPPIPQPAAGIHPSAVISPDAVIGEGASIGPNVTIGARTKIGKNARLHAGVSISEDVVFGDDCFLYPNVVIRERCTLGSRVIIHANSVIGTDGFGYRWDGTQHAKIPQIGTVVIEDDVEIGSCTCIDRAKFSETRIGRGTKIDNLVQVAHNVRIGMFSIVCGQVGIAGTANIGNGVILGGATVVRDHVTVGDRVTAAGNSGIADDIEPNTIVSGVPAIPHRQNLRERSAISRLPELLVEVRKLQEEVELLKKSQQSG